MKPTAINSLVANVEEAERIYGREAMKRKPCPVCGLRRCGMRTCKQSHHRDPCTPALRALVRAAEEWVAGHGRGNTTIEDLVLGVPGIRLVRAVRRFRATKEKR